MLRCSGAGCAVRAAHSTEVQGGRRFLLPSFVVVQLQWWIGEAWSVPDFLALRASGRLASSMPWAKPISTLTRQYTAQYRLLRAVIERAVQHCSRHSYPIHKTPCNRMMIAQTSTGGFILVTSRSGHSKIRKPDQIRQVRATQNRLRAV